MKKSPGIKLKSAVYCKKGHYRTTIPVENDDEACRTCAT